MVLRILVLFVAAIGVAAFVACQSLVGRFLPGVGPLILYVDATIVVKAAMNLCLLLSVAALVMAFMPNLKRTDIAPPLLVLGSAVLGLFGGLYGYMNVQRASAITGVTDLQILAPGYSEALLGVAVGCIPAFFELIRQFRPRPASAE